MQILKPGQVGKGLLVEWDAGYINPNQKENKLILEQFAEAAQNPKPPYAPYPFYMYAVLQKAGVENKNGRIYPFDVLNPEVEKYQTLIPDRSTSELNHPECHRSSAEILTEQGWKFIKDIAEDEKVITLNPENNIIELQTITKKIDQPYKGKMIKIFGRFIDLLVTPNHKIWVINKITNKGKFITAQEIFDGGSELSKYYIPKDGTWDGEYTDVFTLKGVDVNSWNKMKQELREKYSKDIDIDIIAWFQFMGIYLSEGHIAGAKKTNRGNYQKIAITQKNPEKVKKIRELFNRLPFEYKERTRLNGTKDFIIVDARLYNYLVKLGNSHTKYIPNELKQYSPLLLNELFEWFEMGDGRTIGKKYKQSDVFSTSKQLIDDLHEILIKIGGNGRVRTEDRNKDRYITNDDGTKRLIKGKNTQPMHFLTISKTKGLWLDKRFLNVTEEDYDDRVYCVTVPNHIFYVRDHGKAFWNGNSSIIDLERISHRVVKMWWEDRVLMGQLEIITSPAFRNTGQVTCVGDHAALLLSYGITLGISSRGVGSLKNEHGKNIVQSDFEIVCFDLVSSPSTPGAYLFDNMAMKDRLPEMIKNKKDTLISESNLKLIDHLNNFLL